MEIEVIPEFKDKKCRYLALFFGVLFNISPLIIFVIFTLIYDLYLGLGSLIVGYILVSIYISKLRQSFIPFSQSEFNYTNYQVAKFYVKKEFCNDGDNV